MSGFIIVATCISMCIYRSVDTSVVHESVFDQNANGAIPRAYHCTLCTLKRHFVQIRTCTKMAADVTYKDLTHNSILSCYDNCDQAGH